MRTLIIRMNVSLDGYVEAPNGSMDWFVVSDGHWDDLFAAIDGVDTFVVGRGMYAGYAQYWTDALTRASATKGQRAFAERAMKTKHVVVSRTLESAPMLQTSIVRDMEGVARLKREPGGALMAWGGASLASSLLDAGLVDELQLLVNPVVLGGGKALFREGMARRKLTLVEAGTLGTGVVRVRYRTRGE